MLLAGAIFVLTVVLGLWQPNGIGIGWRATLGAVLAVLYLRRAERRFPQTADDAELVCV